MDRLDEQIRQWSMRLWNNLDVMPPESYRLSSEIKLRVKNSSPVPGATA